MNQEWFQVNISADSVCIPSENIRTKQITQRSGICRLQANQQLLLEQPFQKKKYQPSECPIDWSLPLLLQVFVDRRELTLAKKTAVG